MKKIIIGSDHAGFMLKERLKEYLARLGYEIDDKGTYSTDSCDYPFIAYDVAIQISQGKFDKGVLICNTGIGISIAANKLMGVRAALCYNIKAAKLSRQHNDSNIIVFGAAFVDSVLAKRMLGVWLKTEFLSGRHERRVNQIREIEKGRKTVSFEKNLPVKKEG